MQPVMLMMHKFQYFYHLSCEEFYEFDWHSFKSLNECFERAIWTILKDKVVAIVILKVFEEANYIFVLTEQFKSLFFFER